MRISDWSSDVCSSDLKVWIEVDNAKLATLGIPLAAVQQAIDQQNAVVPAGFFEGKAARVQLRISGAFASGEAIRDFPIRAGDRTERLGDLPTDEQTDREARRARGGQYG